jgi:quercetin dioxygenase-like cupin family protein
MNDAPRRFVLIMALAPGLVGSGFAYAQGDPAGRIVLVPSNLKWVDNPAPAGAQTAVLFGDPTKPGPYVMRVKFPPNTKNPPHTHPDNRQATVISGTWYFGQGDNLDTEKATTLPAGTFFTEPANSVHYNFTTSEQVIVQISGTGPTASKPFK